MAKEIKESQIKEFLKRVEVRRERVIKLKTGKEEKKEEEKLERIGEETGERKKVVEKISSPVGGEKKVTEEMGGIKKKAEEPERQKILYLETEKLNLEKQLQELQKNEEPPLLLEKNKLSHKKTGVEKKLKDKKGNKS